MFGFNYSRKNLANQSLKTKHILSIGLILLVSSISLAMYSIITVSLESDLEDKFIESNTHKATSLIHQIIRFIETRSSILVNQSNHPIIQQSIMRPNSTRGILDDYLSNTKIIGKHYKQILLDFRGFVIWETEQHQAHLTLKEHDSKTKYPIEQYKDIFSLKLKQSIQLDAKQENLEIALPASYSNSVEGILLTLIPLAEIEDALQLNNQININIKMTTENQRSFIWAKNPPQTWQETDLENTAIKLFYSIDTESMREAFTDASHQLLLIAILIALCSLFIALTLSNKYLIEPIEQLQQFSAKLSEKKSLDSIQKIKKSTYEINNLSANIILMANKVKSREQSLIDAHHSLKSNQETLLYSEKMSSLGQVSAGVAHEINNPIGFVMANLSTLHEYHIYINKLVIQLLDLYHHLTRNTPNELIGNIDVIAKILEEDDIDFLLNDLNCLIDESIVGTERISDITKAMKGYAYSGEKTSLINMNECIESTLKIVWNELKYKCAIEKDLSSTLPPIECIGGQIDQVLLNIVLNASQAMNENGLLKVRSFNDKNQIHIEIEDNGCGIEKEHLKHIFEPFFTTKEVGQGTGLGMSICYDIIKKHGGNITIKSEVDKGTTFHIILPILRES